MLYGLEMHLVLAYMLIRSDSAVETLKIICAEVYVVV